jgi:CHAT domain-containing protein
MTAARKLPPTGVAGNRRPSITRVSQAAVKLSERGSTLEELRRLVAEVGKSRLVSVVGEEGLIDPLGGLIAEATMAMRSLATTHSGGHAAALDRLEQLLDDPSWTVADISLASLRQNNQALQDYIRTLSEERDKFRIQFESLRTAVARAVKVRAEVSEDDVKLAGEDGQLRQTDQDTAAGRWDTAAVAVERAKEALRAHGLTDPEDLDKRQAEILECAKGKELLEAKMGRRAELFLISGATVQGDVPYKVMLKRPGFQFIQETNLHDDSLILQVDQTLFRDTIDEIAADSVEGIRAAATPETRRARPERKETSQHLQNLDPAARLEKVGKRMYGLLIPDAMQRLIDETPDVPLTITSNNPELPWELMHDGRDYLCLKRMFARMPAGQTFPRRTRDAGYAPPATTRVLLLDSAPDGDLPQAKVEVDEIESALRSQAHSAVTRISGPDVTSIRLTDELSLGSYDVIHYAGHAGFDPDRPELSFLVMAGGERFRADRVQRLLEGHPVVFLNACESSRSGENAPGRPTGGSVAQAQGLASAFVYGGAQACVGALWPVFDDTARAFAIEFYRQLLEGRQRVGEALRLARMQLRKSHSDRVRWAAYALYGDPSYRIGEEATAWSGPNL